jgi:hypothetical protein
MTKKPRKTMQPPIIGGPQVYWTPLQVSYGLRPEELREGMKVGFFRHGFSHFLRSDLPTETFEAATVVKAGDDLLGLRFDDRTGQPKSKPTDWDWLGGLEQYAGFCVPLEKTRHRSRR